jgi:hypothetical protein
MNDRAIDLRGVSKHYKFFALEHVGPHRSGRWP